MAALVDYFLHIEGVDGESPDQKYKGWIQVQAWQWAEENAGRWGLGGGGGSGKVEMKDFDFRMVSNKASPKLFLMCAMGEHIPQAKLVCRKSGQGQQDFLTITFSNCLVSSLRLSATCLLVKGTQYSPTRCCQRMPLALTLHVSKWNTKSSKLMARWGP